MHKGGVTSLDRWAETHQRSPGCRCREKTHTHTYRTAGILDPLSLGKSQGLLAMLPRVDTEIGGIAQGKAGASATSLLGLLSENKRHCSTELVQRGTYLPTCRITLAGFPLWRTPLGANHHESKLSQKSGTILRPYARESSSLVLNSRAVSVNYSKAFSHSNGSRCDVR